MALSSLTSYVWALGVAAVFLDAIRVAYSSQLAQRQQRLDDEMRAHERTERVQHTTHHRALHTPPLSHALMS